MKIEKQFGFQPTKCLNLLIGVEKTIRKFGVCNNVFKEKEVNKENNTQKCVLMV